MFRQMSLGAIVLCVALVAQAQNLALKPDYPEQYVVQPGDTLWDISALFLQDPWLWPEIWHINTQVANPHLIYPGDILRLVFVDGQPRLMPVSDMSTVPANDRVVRMTPQMTSIAREEAIASIPLEDIREFFKLTRVIDEDTAKMAPYMVAGPERRIMIGEGDILYARGAMTPGVGVYQIFRVGDKYRDPETRTVLSIRAELMGTARFESQGEEVAKLTVTGSTSEIIPGDILLPLEQDNLDPVLYPKVPDTEIHALIIAVEGGVNHIGQLDVVAINRGLNGGVTNGTVLAVMERGEEVRDRIGGGTVQLPDERAGVLIVFKSLPQMSFGLILEAEKPLAVGSPLTNP